MPTFQQGIRYLKELRKGGTVVGIDGINCDLAGNYN